MLSSKSRFKIKEVCYIIIFWIFALLIIAFIGFNISCQICTDTPNTTGTSGLSAGTIYFIAIYCGTLSGILFGLLHTFLYPLLALKRGFVHNLVLRGFIFIGILIGIACLADLRFGKSYKQLHLLLSGNTIVALFVYTTIAQVVLDFILLTRKSFGPGYISSLILGKYHHPREKYCIFMFLDLVSSTTIAEKIGHIAFSRFLQDCFGDISDALLDHDARIYQFVGDEVVVMWEVDRKFDREKCLHFYFDCLHNIQQREKYYISNFGCVPRFSASLHEGMVVIATVGKIKQEISYHGDVLNTAARIQGLCKTYSPLLITGQVFDKIKDSGRYHYELLPETPLKGKNRIVQIYAVKNAC